MTSAPSAVPSPRGSVADAVLDALEAEAIWALRETAAAFRKPVMLYSIGKDSGVLLHLAAQGLLPRPDPVPRDPRRHDVEVPGHDHVPRADGEQYDLDLIVATKRGGAAEGVSPFTHGAQEYTRLMKTVALREALDRHGYDAAIGGSRRDEERSRAKERIFSLRMPGHRWEPRRQRPELWRTVNTANRAARRCGRSRCRTGPSSTCGAMSVARGCRWCRCTSRRSDRSWSERPLIVVDDDRMQLEPGEAAVVRVVRFRSLGCYPLSAAMVSEAATLDDVIAEMEASGSPSARAG